MSPRDFARALLIASLIPMAACAAVPESVKQAIPCVGAQPGEQVAIDSGKEAGSKTRSSPRIIGLYLCPAEDVFVVREIVGSRGTQKIRDLYSMPTSIEPAEKHLVRLQVGREVVVALTVTYLDNGGNESENQNIILFRQNVREPQRLSSWLPASIETDKANVAIVLWKNDFSLEASLGVFMPHRYLITEASLEEQSLTDRDLAALQQTVATAVARIEAPGCKTRFSSGNECARLDEVKALATLLDEKLK